MFTISKTDKVYYPIPQQYQNNLRKMTIEIQGNQSISSPDCIHHLKIILIKNSSEILEINLNEFKYGERLSFIELKKPFLKKQFHYKGQFIECDKITKIFFEMTNEEIRLLTMINDSIKLLVKIPIPYFFLIHEIAINNQEIEAKN